MTIWRSGTGCFIAFLGNSERQKVKGDVDKTQLQ